MRQELLELDWEPSVLTTVPARFYLGTHMPQWLSQIDIPLFVSRRRLMGRRSLPRALGRWIQDSGGFTELGMYGGWSTSIVDYVTETRRNMQEIGNMDHAAPQDWMCEAVMLERTGKSVREHQERTVQNFGELRALAPDVPWFPVIQGWSFADYMECVDMYERAGIDLRQEPLVGVGSVCRRQGMGDAHLILDALASMDLRLHAFGFKMQGLAMSSHLLTSADSMAWSFAARRDPPMDGCTHKNCANCQKYAMRWYARVQEIIHHEN